MTQGVDPGVLEFWSSLTGIPELPAAARGGGTKTTVQLNCVASTVVQCKEPTAACSVRELYAVVLLLCALSLHKL